LAGGMVLVLGVWMAMWIWDRGSDGKNPSLFFFFFFFFFLRGGRGVVSASLLFPKNRPELKFRARIQRIHLATL
jgi:hypothetical protein